jgi:GDP-fucose transporter C1
LTIAAASIVTIGFFSGVLFDPNHASSKASAAVAGKSTANLGIMFGALSSLASAGHAVLIKRGLAIVNGSPMALSYYNNILSTAFLIPMVVVAGELPGTLRILSGFDAKIFVAGASITVSLLRHQGDIRLREKGFFGFLISLASMLSIKVTSPVTHSKPILSSEVILLMRLVISSAVRGVLQTFFAVYIFGDVLSR